VRKIADVGGRELQWVKPNWLTMAYELRDGDECVATLRFRSTFGTHATAESGDGCWTFKRIGFLQTHATIRPCGADHDIAVFKNNAWTGGGVLELADGRRYKANTNFWMTAFEFTTEDGRSLVRFRRIGSLPSLSSAVEIPQTVGSLEELPWLVTLGWYLTVQLYRDSATVGVGGGGGA
jgi:hypothetical protein